MSRYRADPHYSDGNLAYRDPPPQRWDADRFVREREIRAPVAEHPRPPYADYPPPRRAPVYEDQRYHEEDRFGPRGSTERRVFEETDYYDPRAARGQLVPYAPERPSRPEAPPRPGIIRRQSSLDTFDRQPNRRINEYDEVYRSRRVAPPRELIPVRPPSPRRPPQPRYDERSYDDIRVQDPDYYGDDGFREYREREWVSSKRRNSSPSPDRRTVREETFEKEEIKEEKPYPRRGKTRMPKRLVHTKVLFDLGYPFYEEDERTIIIEKALGPENIDEIFARSKEYREREVGTTRLIEAPRGSDVIIEKTEKIEEIKTVPLTEAPRSVREWDGLSVRSPSPRSHRSHSRRRSRRGYSQGVVKETFVEKKEVFKEVSPARTHRSSHTRHHGSSHHGSSVSDETIIERKITKETDFDDSNSVHVGPLALVVDRKPHRNERDIKEEIRILEAERRALRRERKYEREGGGEIVKIERVRDRSPSPRGEVIIERRGDELLEVKKDRRGRSRSAAPSPAIIRAMMATLT